MKLSTHFSIVKLAKTSYADLQQDNLEEALLHVKQLTDLCMYVLEPVRLYYNKPVIITSGFRGNRLNERVGGSLTSQHSRGEAADFVINGISNDTIIGDILNKKIRLNFGQAIKEVVLGKQWTHLSLGEPYRKSELCRQVLSTTDGKTYQLLGVVK